MAKPSTKPPVVRQHPKWMIPKGEARERRPSPDDVLPANTLQVMRETQARVAAMTPAERNAPLKKKKRGRENVDPNLG